MAICKSLKLVGKKGTICVAKFAQCVIFNAVHSGSLKWMGLLQREVAQHHVQVHWESRTHCITLQSATIEIFFFFFLQFIPPMHPFTFVVRIAACRHRRAAVGRLFPAFKNPNTWSTALTAGCHFHKFIQKKKKNSTQRCGIYNQLCTRAWLVCMSKAAVRNMKKAVRNVKGDHT